MTDRLIGAAFDQYQLLSLLAEGPAATVYLGRQISIDRPVAVKMYPRKFAKGRRFMERFRQEAGALARLEHINIVPMYGFGEYEGQPYLVLRYYEGGSLADLIRDAGALPPGNVARIVRQIGNALGHAHSQDMIHRNLKASNILLDSTGTAYLSDFAIERIERGRGERSGDIGGLAAMSLEQAAGGPPDPMMDVYGLGVVAYHMLAGQIPYVAESLAELVELHDSTSVPFVTDANPEVPPTISAVVAKAMAKQPAECFQTVQGLADTFGQAVDKAGLGEVTPFETIAAAGQVEDVSATIPLEGEPSEALPVAAETMPAAAADAVGATLPTEGEPTRLAPPASETVQAIESARVPMPTYIRPRRMPLWPFAIVAGLVIVIGAVVGILWGLHELGYTLDLGGAPPTFTLPPTPNLLTRTPQLPTQPPATKPAPAVDVGEGERKPEAEPATDLQPEIVQYGVEMVLVPAGSFQMGNPDWPDQRPVHEVTVDTFYIDKYEVTNAEFQGCVRDDVCKPHDETTAPGIFGYFGENYYAIYPVIYMSWEDAADYCRWREARLPTEAEWEKAARWDPQTGETRNYPWGNAFPDPRLANYYEAGIGRPVEVTAYPEGVSAVGAHNMAGNVSEWVADWYDENYYDVSPTDNPQGPETGSYKVLRGASFDTTSGGVVPSSRWAFSPTTTAVDFGFRCALTPE